MQNGTNTVEANHSENSEWSDGPRSLHWFIDIDGCPVAKRHSDLKVVVSEGMELMNLSESVLYFGCDESILISLWDLRFGKGNTSERMTGPRQRSDVEREWYACLDSKNLHGQLIDIRASVPPSVSMAMILKAMVMHWDMCSAPDKIKHLSEAFGFDEANLEPGTIMEAEYSSSAA